MNSLHDFQPEKDVSGGLFYDSTDGLPLKFHIQKHIGPVDDGLRKLITASTLA